MRSFIVISVLLACTACLSLGAPTADDKPSLNSKRLLVKELNGEPIDIYDNTFLTDDSESKLLTYDPMAKRLVEYQNSEVRPAGALDNMVEPKRSRNLEREQEPDKGQVGASSLGPQQPVNQAELADAEKFGSIAFNSREVRLMGPNQKEVEMKDDVASKMVVVLDNLQKEATEVWGQVNEKLDKGWKEIKRSEVWGQVNDKLDKGWTDLKTMVEGVVAPSARRQP